MLNGGDRTQRNTLQNNPKCDGKDLPPGWYRFQGAAGYRMADKCIPMFRCGTDAPGWLSGTHPTVAEGLVTRNVCYNWHSNCCNLNNTIRVRNCGAYFVYELSYTPTCPARYCGNAGAGEFLSVSAENHTSVGARDLVQEKGFNNMLAAMFVFRNLTSILRRYLTSKQKVSEKFTSAYFFQIARENVMIAC